MRRDPPRQQRLRGYVLTGCIKCGGHSKKIVQKPNDCCLRKEMTRSREKQEWRRAVSEFL